MFQKLQTMKKNKKKGFTLIELIVVIAILAILALLAVPQYNGLREQAAEGVANANARSVYTAAMAVEAIGIPSGSSLEAEVVKMLDSDDFKTGQISVTKTGTKITSATWEGVVNGTSKTGKYVAGATAEEETE